MNRRNQKPPDPAPLPVPQPAQKKSVVVARYAVIFLLGAGLTAGGFMAFSQNNRPAISASLPSSNASRSTRTYEQLLAMTPDQLTQVDIAEMNLLCATGLPGAEDMNIAKCLATLDKWANRVHAETERHLYRLTDPRYKDHAEHYQNSEARFRAEWLVSIL